MPIQGNIQLGADIRTTRACRRTMSTRCARNTPQPGDDYIAQSKHAAALDKAIQSNEAAKKADPADFLIRRTQAGADAYAGSKSFSPTKRHPQLKQAYAGMFADTMLAEQQRLGVDPANAAWCRSGTPTTPEAGDVARRLGRRAAGGAGAGARAQLWATTADVYRRSPRTRSRSCG